MKTDVILDIRRPSLLFSNPIVGVFTRNCGEDVEFEPVPLISGGETENVEVRKVRFFLTDKADLKVGNCVSAFYAPTNLKDFLATIICNNDQIEDLKITMTDKSTVVSFVFNGEYKDND
ncbi:hypothetical protein [Peromfec virus RodF8_20]|uniref:Uncharacterized protein n=1 Tax=Peromfec virus RodF8_20 TaxID=2929362 RepID=A0A976N273_9VIRU|nr:hypothetical protein [Peromfec virus RodF8_20]